MAISVVQVLLGNGDYKKLKLFFTKSWEQRMPQTEAEDYKYRVYIARRCFLLNEIFYQENAAEIEQGKKLEIWKDVRRKTFLNQYGLMCKAQELATCYGSEMQRFPSILIVDELAIYGREISRLLIKMTTLIVDAYVELFGPVSGEAENKIKSDFLAAVDIQVYGRNQKKLLLPEMIENRLTPTEWMPARRWHSFVRNISALTTHTEGVGNKSYYPLFSVGKELLKETVDEKSWSYGYHGKRLRVFQEKASGILFTFCERDIGAKKEYLPIPLWGDLPRDRAEVLLSETANVFAAYAQETDRTDFHYVIRLLREKALGLLQIQYQMISFIMAVLSFYDFAWENWQLKINDGICSVDIERCAMNFGPIEEIEPELREIIDEKNDALREKLKKAIYTAFSESTELLSPVSAEKTSDMGKLLWAVESYFSNISTEDERALAAMRASGQVFDVLTRDYDIIPLQDYLNAEDIPGSAEDRVFALLLLLEDGQISINVQLCDGKVQLRVKTGEYVKFIEAERIRRFIPALSILEDWSGRVGYSPERKLCEFGEFIGKTYPARYEGIDEIFHSFINTQYTCGDKVSDWNIDFIKGMNTPDFDRKEWLIYPWSGRPWNEEEKDSYRTLDQPYWQWERNQEEEVFELLKQYVKDLSC